MTRFELVETRLAAVVQRFVSAIWVEESKANMRLSPSSSRNAQAVSVPRLGSVSVRAKRRSYAFPVAGAGCSSASITVVPGVVSNVPPHSLASRTRIRSGAVRMSRAPASAATSVVSRKGTPTAATEGPSTVSVTGSSDAWAVWLRASSSTAATPARRSTSATSR